MNPKVPVIGVMIFCTAFLLAISVERLHVLGHPDQLFDSLIFAEMAVFIIVGLFLSAVTAVKIYKLLKK